MLNKHPDTGVMYTAQEAADMIGMSLSGFYDRRRIGDKGKRLWRPPEDRSHNSKLPSNEFDIKTAQSILQTIPTETDYDKEANNGLSNNQGDFIHSDFNRI